MGNETLPRLMTEPGKATNTMWPSPSPETADWLFTLSNALLIVGGCLTVLATIGVVWTANLRDRYLKRDLAEANVRIAEANAASEAAKADAAKARRDLAKTVMPRMLFPDNVETIVAKIKTFAGTKFAVAFGQDVEQGNLVTWIELALRRAGWEQVDWKGGAMTHLREGRPVAGIVAARHVVISFDHDRRDALKPAAEALSKALSDEEIIAVAISAPNKSDLDPDVLQVLVGTRF